MPKYLLKVNYSPSGVTGVLKEGGGARHDAAKQLIESLGGSMESFYFAWGDTDVFLVADMPDAASAAAAALTVSGSGAATVSTTPLLTAADVDAAAQKHGDYRPPGA
jgi:uncharacterized protein with GYD domain